MIKILNLQLSDMFCHAIANRSGFETYMDSYSAWSRRELDCPKHYRCWLGSKIKSENPEISHWTRPMSDDEALFLDHCLQQAVKGDTCMYLLAQSVVVSNNSCLDVLCTNKFLRHQYKKARRKFNLQSLLDDKNLILKRTQSFACDFLGIGVQRG